MIAPLSRRGIFGATLALAVPATASAAPQPFQHPDAELVRLARELWAEWDISDAYFASAGDLSGDAVEAAMAPAGDIVDRIELIAPRTLDGFRVHALALAWCKCWDRTHPAEIQGIEEDCTTSGRILQGLLAGLLAGGAP